MLGHALLRTPSLVPPTFFGTDLCVRRNFCPVIVGGDQCSAYDIPASAGCQQSYIFACPRQALLEAEREPWHYNIPVLVGYVALGSPGTLHLKP